VVALHSPSIQSLAFSTPSKMALTNGRKLCSIPTAYDSKLSINLYLTWIRDMKVVILWQDGVGDFKGRI
jgi:hypothetical protein